MEGEPFDIPSLYTPEGKSKISVLTLAHLADAERMFLSLLLNRIIAWMRTEQGPRPFARFSTWMKCSATSADRESAR